MGRHPSGRVWKPVSTILDIDEYQALLRYTGARNITVSEFLRYLILNALRRDESTTPAPLTVATPEPTTESTPTPTPVAPPKPTMFEPTVFALYEGEGKRPRVMFKDELEDCVRSLSYEELQRLIAINHGPTKEFLKKVRDEKKAAMGNTEGGI